MRDITTEAEGNPPMTVVLNGVIYDAVVSGYARTEEVEAVQLVDAILPDGDYTVTADVSDLAGPCLSLLATSAGNDIAANLTLKRYRVGDSSGRLLVSFVAAPNQLKLMGRQYLAGSLAEPDVPWVTHSTRKPSSQHAMMTVRNSGGRIAVPSTIVLTPRVLLGALGKLPTYQIEEAVEGLIAMLDSRSGDSDLEVDADGEIEADEQSDQVVNNRWGG